MGISRKQLKLYAITDSRLLKDGTSLCDAVEQAVMGGATIVQLREKEKSEDEIIETAKELKKVCERYNVPLIVNDSIKIAYKSGADGVHLGLDDGDPIYARRVLGENAIIGATAHNLLEAQMALAEGVDYIGCGAIFTSPTKKDTVPLPIDNLKEICKRISSIPIVAIGGINAENISRLRGTDIAGIAVVSAIFAQDNIRTSATLLRDIAEKIL